MAARAETKKATASPVAKIPANPRPITHLVYVSVNNLRRRIIGLPCVPDYGT